MSGVGRREFGRVVAIVADIEEKKDDMLAGDSVEFVLLYRG